MSQFVWVYVVNHTKAATMVDVAVFLTLIYAALRHHLI